MTLGASVGLPPAGGIDEASGAGCSTDMATQREPIKSHALMPVGLAHVLPGRVPLVGTPLASSCRATPPSIFAGTTLRFSASASTRTAWRLNCWAYDPPNERNFLRPIRCMLVLLCGLKSSAESKRKVFVGRWEFFCGERRPSQIERIFHWRRRRFLYRRLGRFDGWLDGLAADEGANRSAAVIAIICHFTNRNANGFFWNMNAAVFRYTSGNPTKGTLELLPLRHQLPALGNLDGFAVGKFCAEFTDRLYAACDTFPPAALKIMRPLRVIV
jgi:hypothetical protein